MVKRESFQVHKSDSNDTLYGLFDKYEDDPHHVISWPCASSPSTLFLGHTPRVCIHRIALDCIIHV